jgi:serine phosphatase RsbU (regulator of sigma subunit)
MKLLKQKGEEGEAADGMDIGIIVLDKNKETIEYSGANNSLYQIRNNEIAIFKGNRMPIGIHLLYDKPFQNQSIVVKKGDIFYLFTDGYADQFGGPRNKKFRYNQLQSLLLDIHKLTMEEQKIRLIRTINEWKGDNQQVDDIMTLSFKI